MYFELEIDVNGDWVESGQVDRILGRLSAEKFKAILIMSHGWNNSIDDARSLYRRFFGLLGRSLDPCITIGILWPSMKFIEASEIPGGAASLASGPAERQSLSSALDQLKSQPCDEEGCHQLFSVPREELLQLFASTQSAAGRLLNVTTYYRMKARAGLVGQNGVRRLIDGIHTFNIPVHLIGHSFGARVVTSAASRSVKSVASLILLQAAFSHHAFSPDYDASHSPGAFRNVIHPGAVDGPILVSHTKRDHDVGIAYAIASRLARQNAAFVGDASDPYGGLGRNGARKTPEAVDGELGSIRTRYYFAPGAIYNLQADDIILSHGDIVKPEVVNAVLQATRLL